MWQSIDQNSISLAKKRGNPRVEWAHVGVVLADVLTRHGVALPLPMADYCGRLPAPGNSLGVPVLPEDIRDRLKGVRDTEAAADLLRQVGGEQPVQRSAEADRSNSAPAVRAAQQDDSAGTPDAGQQQEGLAHVLDELNDLVGLETVKSRVRQLIATHQVNARQEALGRKVVPLTLHLVFTGDPGTGKTTVARLVARLYSALRLLPTGALHEVTRADLVGEYVGQTAPRVRQQVTRAMGGVLFIDEAYALAEETGSNDFGREAVAELVKLMEDHRGGFAVIAAGYPQPMLRFVESNPGLRSRFQTYLHFADYSAAELVEIWQHLARSYEIQADHDVVAAVRDHLDRAETGGVNGNARYVRMLFEQMYANLSQRAAADGSIEDSEIVRFVPSDVPDAPARAQHDASLPGYGEYL